jgi:hypothetical protein
VNRAEAFAKGAREGHEAGQHRAGQYTMGEELIAAWDASDAYGYQRNVGHAFEQGFCYGYRLACEGAALNPKILREVG